RTSPMKVRTPSCRLRGPLPPRRPEGDTFMNRVAWRRWVRRGMLALPWLGLACSQVAPNIPATPQKAPPTTPGLMYAPSPDENFRFRMNSAPAGRVALEPMPISLDAVLG